MQISIFLINLFVLATTDGLASALISDEEQDVQIHSAVQQIMQAIDNQTRNQVTKDKLTRRSTKVSPSHALKQKYYKRAYYIIKSGCIQNGLNKISMVNQEAHKMQNQLSHAWIDLINNHNSLVRRGPKFSNSPNLNFHLKKPIIVESMTVKSEPSFQFHSLKTDSKSIKSAPTIIDLTPVAKGKDPSAISKPIIVETVYSDSTIRSRENTERTDAETLLHHSERSESDPWIGKTIYVSATGFDDRSVKSEPLMGNSEYVLPGNQNGKSSTRSEPILGKSDDSSDFSLGETDVDAVVDPPPNFWTRLGRIGTWIGKAVVIFGILFSIIAFSVRGRSTLQEFDGIPMDLLDADSLS